MNTVWTDMYWISDVDIVIFDSLTCRSSKYSVWESGVSLSPVGRMRVTLTPRCPDRLPAGRGGSRTTACGTVMGRSSTHPASTSGTKFAGGGGNHPLPHLQHQVPNGVGAALGSEGLGLGEGSAVWLLVSMSVCLSLTIPGTYWVLINLPEPGTGILVILTYSTVHMV